MYKDLRKIFFHSIYVIELRFLISRMRILYGVNFKMEMKTRISVSFIFIVFYKYIFVSS